MIKSIILLLLSALSFSVFAQIALINDPDGFTNVRKGKSTNSEILYRVTENQPFFIDIEYVDLDSTWIKVWISADKFSRNNGTPNIIGFIHKSRIKLIDSINLAEKEKPKLIFEIKEADSSAKLNAIPYGLEGGFSNSYEVDALHLYWNGKRIPQDTKLYDDLFNVVFEKGTYTSDSESFKTYKQNETYFIRQRCGDGAGYYEIVWVIKNGAIVQRLAGWIF